MGDLTTPYGVGYDEETIMAKLIRVNGTIESVQPHNPKEGFTLHELYRLLNVEMIQHVPVGEFGIVIDEEDKLNGALPTNKVATALFQSELLPGDYLVGDCLVIETKGEFQ